MPCPDTWLIEMAVNAKVLEQAALGVVVESGSGLNSRKLMGEAEYDVHVRQAAPGRFTETEL